MTRSATYQWIPLPWSGASMTHAITVSATVGYYAGTIKTITSIDTGTSYTYQYNEAFMMTYTLDTSTCIKSTYTLSTATNYLIIMNKNGQIDLKTSIIILKYSL
jgi:hypothetical protein